MGQPKCGSVLDLVLAGVNASPLGDGGRDDRLDRHLLHIGQHAQHHLAAALQPTSAS